MIRALLLALALALAVPAAWAGDAPSAPVRLRSVQAAFVQEKHLAMLSRPLVSQGTFAFQSPQSLRWEYHQPLRSLLLLHGGKVRKLVERDGRLIEEKGMGADAMLIVLQEISAWMDGRFADNPAFSAVFPDRRTIVLTPKEQSFGAFISRIELRLAAEEGLMEAVTIFEGPEAFTRLTFAGSAINQDIPAAVFTEP